MERSEQSPVQAPTMVMHIVLAATTAALTLLGTLVAAEPAPRSAQVAGPVLACLLAGLVGVAIRLPRLALVVSMILVVTYHLADFPAIGLAWPLAIVLYLAAAAGAAALSGSAMAALIAGSGLWRVYIESDPWLAVADGMAREAVLSAIAVLLGEVVHRRAAWRKEITQRFADRQRQRDHELRHAADQQRLTVAREVHDTVAHTLAVVGVQADVAAETLRHGDPGKATDAIDIVRRTNRRALQELRTTVELLRGDAPQGEPRTPAPSLAELPALIGHIEKSGLRVEIHNTEDLSLLPSLVGATAYRVIQEALTNIVRHANASRAHIDLGIDGGELHVEVTDDGCVLPSTSESVGNGLRGMRERAAALGGQLHTGRRAGGGFRVHLRVPIAGPQ